MEAVSETPARFGRPMERDLDGHTGGGQLFLVRRATDFELGLLTEKGNGNNYLAFRPSDMFMRNLGDDVLRLNDALFHFRVGVWNNSWYSTTLSCSPITTN